MINMECQEKAKKKGSHGFSKCKCRATYEIGEVGKPNVVMAYVCKTHAKLYQNYDEFVVTPINRE